MGVDGSWRVKGGGIKTPDSFLGPLPSRVGGTGVKKHCGGSDLG